MEDAMAFGFPARHSEDYVCEIPGANLRVLVRRALQVLAWSIKEESYGRIVASSSMNLVSWGEKIEIEFLSNTEISVTSKCLLPTQWIDWGQNKRNIKKLIRKIEECAS
jgi:hypothetical protein